MTVLVHHAQRHDVGRLAPLFDAYRQFYGKPGDLAGAHAFLAHRIERQESTVLYAVESTATEDLLGFVQLYPTFSSLSLARAMVLNDLFVIPIARRRGVAAALVQASCDQARSSGSRVISLATQWTNAAAQALYIRFGFVREDEFVSFSLHLPGADG